MAIIRKIKRIIFKLLFPLTLFTILVLFRRTLKTNDLTQNQKRHYVNMDMPEFGRYSLNDSDSPPTTTYWITSTENLEDDNNIKKQKLYINQNQNFKKIEQQKLAGNQKIMTTTLEKNRSSLLSPEDIIHDSDVIESLKNYTFKLRTSDPTVIQRYLGGENSVRIVREKCNNITYDFSVLPTAAVVISFHENERVPSILHTVHSIYQNSPKEILKEIILIDDMSRKESHKEPLEDYIKKHFPPNLVKIHRHLGPDNLGLIQGRLLGIKMSTSKVIVVMDAHMEVQPKWLEPMVQAIYEQRNIMATSMLDWMRPTDSDPDKWVYDHGSPRTKTTWVWKTFNFGFRDSRRLDLDDLYPVKPIDTPMSVGTIWAMDKDFFFEIGGFDDNMVLWGGENIDLPIRIHLCSGGRVVNIPCSKASHQEMRHQRDYRAGWRAKFLINFKRIAEVWLDGEYKETFDFYNHALSEIDPGDLTERLKLKAEKCPRSFGYYMTKAFPEMGVDAMSFAWKGMMNMKSKLCFYYSPDHGLYKMASCAFVPAKEQAIFLSIDGHLRQYLSVFNFAMRGDAIHRLVRMDYYYTYNNKQLHTKWIHTREGCLYALKLKLCLAVEDNGTFSALPCNGTCIDPKMQWRFKKYTHYYQKLRNGTFKPQSQTEHMYYDIFHDTLVKKEQLLKDVDISESETVFRNYMGDQWLQQERQRLIIR